MFQKKDYVYQVYRERSFTKAAEKLHISQPCLSAAVKKLEEQLGQPLFQRRYSDLQLTELGRAYIAAAEEIMALEAAFLEKVRDTAALEQGSLTVGGSNYVMSYILPQVVSRFSQTYPKLQISLVEANSIELEKKLAEEEIDLLIDSFDTETEQYACVPLLREKILLAVPAANACNAGLKHCLTAERIFSQDAHSLPEVPLAPFAQENFILLKSGNNMYAHAAEVFLCSGITPKVSFRLDQLNTSYALVASGLGVCFITDTFFKYHRVRDAVKLYNVAGSGSRTLYIARKKNRFLSGAMKAFVEIAQKTVQG